MESPIKIDDLGVPGNVNHVPVNLEQGYRFENNVENTILLFNIAMENGPFIDGLPMKNCDFPWLC